MSASDRHSIRTHTLAFVTRNVTVLLYTNPIFTHRSVWCWIITCSLSATRWHSYTAHFTSRLSLKVRCNLTLTMKSKSRLDRFTLIIAILRIMIIVSEVRGYLVPSLLHSVSWCVFWTWLLSFNFGITHRFVLYWRSLDTPSRATRVSHLDNTSVREFLGKCCWSALARFIGLRVLEQTCEFEVCYDAPKLPRCRQEILQNPVCICWNSEEERY